MPTYSKVVSVIKQIDTAHVFIGGTRKDITSGWTFVNGVRKQVFPSAENYTKVYENNTPGAYSTTLSWGRYKIVLSGAGGSGGASSSAHNSYLNYANNGAPGKTFTAYIDVASGDTRTISGIIGSGGKSCTARGYDNGNGSYSVGAAGTGATNGTKGTGQVVNTETTIPRITSAAAAGGSGGGSTSAVGIGTAAGGAGGNCRALNSANRQANGTGGAGGSGSNQGNGAAGGAGRYAWDALATSGAGSNGYIHIYKSNIYPE